MFCPTLIKSGQLLGLFGRVGTCTRVHTYLGGGVTSWLQVFYSLPFGDLLQCIQNSPDSTGVSKDSVVLLSKPPVCTLLPGFNLCRTLHWNNPQKTWPYIFHYFLIFKFNYTFVKCTIYFKREFIDSFCQSFNYSYLCLFRCVYKTPLWRKWAHFTEIGRLDVTAAWRNVMQYALGFLCHLKSRS